MGDTLGGGKYIASKISRIRAEQMVDPALFTQSCPNPPEAAYERDLLLFVKHNRKITRAISASQDLHFKSPRMLLLKHGKPLFSQLLGGSFPLCKYTYHLCCLRTI